MVHVSFISSAENLLNNFVERIAGPNESRRTAAP